MLKSEPLVLAIDDDPCVGRVIELKLEAEGYRTLRALTAEDGLEVIRQHQPDVVITDVRLPGLSGTDLCRLLEPLQAAHKFLVIVLTSKMDPENKAWIESDPLRRFMSKPFSPRALAAMVRQYVQSGRIDEVSPERAASDSAH